MPVLIWNAPGHRWNAGFTWAGPTQNSSSHMANNLISAVFSAEDKAAVLAAIQTIKTKMPFILGLSAEARKEMARLGDKTVGFDVNCQAGMASMPELIPGFVDQPELAKDRALWAPVGEVLGELEQLTDSVRDTFDVIGSEVYDADRAFYNNVREAAKRGMPGAQTLYDTLKVRFPGRPRGSSGGEPPAGGGGTPPPTP